MQNQIEDPICIMTAIEGMNIDSNRIRAYENSAFRTLFVVKWNKDEKRDNLCLPVFTVEGELIGHIRKDIDNIKKLFTEYSDPVAVLMTKSNGSFLTELYFSKDKEKLQSIRMREELRK